MVQVWWKKYFFIFYSILLCGAGALVQNSCGSATAQDGEGGTTAAAVTFDNSSTGLSATNIQDAVEELHAGYGSVSPSSDIVGTWSGTVTSVINMQNLGNATFIFNSDGTASCSTTISGFGDCTDVRSYNMIGRNLLRIQEDEAEVWNISFISASTLTLYDNGSGNIFDLTKD